MTVSPYNDSNNFDIDDRNTDIAMYVKVYNISAKLSNLTFLSYLNLLILLKLRLNSVYYLILYFYLTAKVDGKSLTDVLDELQGVVSKAGKSIASSINKGIGQDGATAATGGVGGGIGGGEGANFEEKLSAALSGGDTKALSLLGLAPSPDFYSGMQTGLVGGTGEVVSNLFSGLSDFGQLFGNSGTNNFLAASTSGIQNSFTPALYNAGAAGQLGSAAGYLGSTGCIAKKRNCIPLEAFLGKFVNVLNNVKKHLPAQHATKRTIDKQGKIH